MMPLPRPLPATMRSMFLALGIWIRVDLCVLCYFIGMKFYFVKKKKKTSRNKSFYFIIRQNRPTDISNQEIIFLMTNTNICLIDFL